MAITNQNKVQTQGAQDSRRSWTLLPAFAKRSSDQVTPQPGGFYGGWITAREAGPFKGIPGSRFW
jgi:hypothetical protein